MAKISIRNMKKRSLFALVGAFVIGLIGVTFAISHDWANFANDFTTDDMEVQAEEIYIPENDWTPCEEVNKVAVARNKGNVPVVVRMKIEENWRNAANTSDLSNTKDDVVLATKIFQNESDWTLRSDGYYYYKNALAKNEETTSLLKSVKLNCNANFGGVNTCTETETGKLCEKPADEYEGAIYHLKATFEFSPASSHLWD